MTDQEEVDGQGAEHDRHEEVQDADGAVEQEAQQVNAKARHAKERRQPHEHPRSPMRTAGIQPSSSPDAGNEKQRVQDELRRIHSGVEHEVGNESSLANAPGAEPMGPGVQEHFRPHQHQQRERGHDHVVRQIKQHQHALLEEVQVLRPRLDPASIARVGPNSRQRARGKSHLHHDSCGVAGSVEDQFVSAAIHQRDRHESQAPKEAHAEHAGGQELPRVQQLATGVPQDVPEASEHIEAVAPVQDGQQQRRSPKTVQNSRHVRRIRGSGAPVSRQRARLWFPALSRGRRIRKRQRLGSQTKRRRTNLRGKRRLRSGLKSSKRQREMRTYATAAQAISPRSEQN
eukprot:scaffold2862_cov272-Pinguiococcus_pyrenoidosus.AAC.1